MRLLGVHFNLSSASVLSNIYMCTYMYIIYSDLYGLFVKIGLMSPVTIKSLHLSDNKTKRLFQ